MSDKHSIIASAAPCDVEPPYTELPLAPQLPGSSSSPPSPSPPPFSSLYFPPPSSPDLFRTAIGEPGPPPEFWPGPPVEAAEGVPPSDTSVEAETKAALPKDIKGESSHKGAEEEEPPPPYAEGSSPLDSFTYVMAATGGPASIITQVQQGGGPPVNSLAGMSLNNLIYSTAIGIVFDDIALLDVGADEQITLDLR